MFLTRHARERIARLTLRAKLTLALLGLAVIGAVSGGIGLIYLQTISRTLTVYSGITAPLVAESAALMDDAKRMNSAYQAALANLTEADAAGEEITRSNADALERIDRIGATAQTWIDQKNSHAVQLGATALSQTRYARALQTAITRNRDADAAGVNVESRIREIQAIQTRIDSRLLRLTGSAEARMAEAGGRDANGHIEAATATARLEAMLGETFPLLQAFNTLLRESARLRDTTFAYDGLSKADRLHEAELALTTSLSSAEATLQRIEKRLHDPDALAEMARLRDEWARLAALYQDPTGLISAQRASLEARSRYQTAHRHSEELREVAVGVAARVDSLIRDLNDQARLSAVSTTKQAVYAFALVTLMAFGASLLLGRSAANHLVRPLDRLTERANLVGNTAGEVIPPDPETGLRQDEFGILSRAFDAMLVDLAAARMQIVSETRAILKHQVELLDAALDNMSQGLCMYDAEMRLIIANPRMHQIYGHSSDDLTPGTPLTEVLDLRATTDSCGKNREHYVAERIAQMSLREPWTSVDELRDGRVISVIGTPLANGGCVITHEDITERRDNQARIAHLAYHDGLTDLANRTRFNEALDDALAVLDDQTSLAVLCLDLDRFKAVNDSLGHLVGDALLKEVAGRVSACIGPDDLVARLGGDEFAIIQASGQQPNAARDLAEAVITALSRPYDIAGHAIVIGTSVGIAIAPEDGVEPHQVLQHADMALYRAKADGRGTARFFETEMDQTMQVRRQMEVDLRAAVEAGAFELHYQPLVNLASNCVSGFEALLRWRHPERGPVSPAEFIPVLEEIGLIGEVGAWVLKTACREAATWPGRQKIAVNLSALQFKQRPIALDVATALMTSGLTPARLELEITEGVLLQDTSETIAILKDLRELGVRISMDDFGTGYSSLSYLRSFPFDKIKIDQSFVRDMETSEDSIAIIRAVTGLGVSLGMSTTAEGVETETQLAKLRAEGCTEAQGYLLSRPKPASEIPAMIASVEETLTALAA